MTDLRCDRCDAFLGEAAELMRLVGVFKAARDTEHVDPPRYSWRCKGCGWINIFRALDKQARMR